MCGIAGILGADDGACVPAMTAALRHRGPDHQSTLDRPRAHLGAARLRIVDLTAGDQPLVSARTGAALVFNGEIYNYRELRALLGARGHRFETASDTEVVLRAYEEWGWRCVEQLRGMYAFAVVDGARALLARDPLGIKPLHYCLLDGGRRLAFASEIKALLRCPEVPARLNEAALGDLHVFQYVADIRATLFEGIANLEPGACLEIALSGERLDVQAHRIVPPTAEPPATLEAAEEELAARLDAALRSHRMGDVPLCLTLSGGLDSTFLALVLRQQVGTGVVSYVTGDDAQHADVETARRMAGLLGFEHRPVLVGFEQYLAAIPATIHAGESFTDSVPQYLLFQAIGRDFRVALNGEGADEVFGGYPEHWFADRYVARIRQAPPSLLLTAHGTAVREMLASTPDLDADVWMYEHLLGAQLADRHLHPLDKLGMAASVEVRVPFLADAVAAYARALPSAWRVNRALGSSKHILRQVYLRRWQTTADPGLLDAVRREKRGFPDARRASDGRFHHVCDRVLPERYFAEHPHRELLFHKVQAIWLDLFQLIFCEHRGVLPAGLDVVDFVAERAGTGRAAVVAAIEASATAARFPRS
jgi:asparagine synthase (glutamine-hydrolysing)